MKQIKEYGYLATTLKKANKKIKVSYCFASSGIEEKDTFKAIDEAEKFLESLGYSTGSMCGDMPIGIAKGDISIAKWRNISPSEYYKLDGVILSYDFRNGSCVVVLFE